MEMLNLRMCIKIFVIELNGERNSSIDGSFQHCHKGAPWRTTTHFTKRLLNWSSVASETQRRTSEVSETRQFRWVISFRKHFIQNHSSRWVYRCWTDLWYRTRLKKDTSAESCRMFFLDIILLFSITMKLMVKIWFLVKLAPVSPKIP